MREVRDGLCYEYPLRPDFTAQLVLPCDMTDHDVRRLCAFLTALVLPESEGDGDR